MIHSLLQVYINRFDQNNFSKVQIHQTSMDLNLQNRVTISLNFWLFLTLMKDPTGNKFHNTLSLKTKVKR